MNERTELSPHRLDQLGHRQTCTPTVAGHRQRPDQAAVDPALLAHQGPTISTSPMSQRSLNNTNGGMINAEKMKSELTISRILPTSLSTIVLAPVARVPTAFCCCSRYSVFSLADIHIITLTIISRNFTAHMRCLSCAPLDTFQVISETIFPVSLSTGVKLNRTTPPIPTQINKPCMYGTATQLHVRGKIHWSKVEHP